MAARPPRDRDRAAWAAAQARLLREGRLADLDVPGLAAEMEASAERQGEELDARLAALVTRLLLWKYLPGARLPSWQGDGGDERRAIAGLHAATPSRSDRLAAAFPGAYQVGRRRAAAETGIHVGILPEAPAFTLEEAVDATFLPLEPGLELYRKAPRT